MNMQAERKELKEKIISSNIILWGDTQLARDFYNEYKSLLNIVGCITEESAHPMYLDEVNEQVPVIMWQNYKREAKDYFIITKSPFSYVVNQLMANHWEMFKDFTDYNTSRAVLTNKKIAVLAGDCQMQVIFQMMK